MAGSRRSGREPGKSDFIDALATARAALREPDLPVARLDGPERDIRLLVEHREDLVAERTRIEQRLCWHLHELMPREESPARGLDRRYVLDGLEVRLATLEGTVVRITLELVARVRELTMSIDCLEREIRGPTEAQAPTLLALEGCGPLAAAKLLGGTAGVTRFRSAAAFARHNGSAPIPSGPGTRRGIASALAAAA
jgi:transposase